MTDKREISLTVSKDGQPLDLENLPEGLSALNLVGSEMMLDGFPVRVWNDMGKVAFKWRGIQSELEWKDPAGVLLEALTSLSEAIG